MTVIVSSAEALALVEEAPAFAERIAGIACRLDADASLGALLDLGPCVYLSNGMCQVYPVRPDACRAAHVWHDESFCGRPEFEMCIPAELNKVRLEHLRRRMLHEFDLGRRPFRGYLLPAVWLMGARRADYLAGADLAADSLRPWRGTDLLEFPTHEELLAEGRELDSIFREERNPLGFPRADRATDRRLLEAFDMRVEPAA